MNATETHAMSQPGREWTIHREESVSFTEATGAIGAVVLAIIGLAGILAHTLAAIATIVVGAAILLEGGTFASRYRQPVSRVSGEGQTLEPRAGLTAEFMGGVAGIVLGILALFGTYPDTLLAAAVIVFGATFLLGGTALSRWNWVMGFRTQAGLDEVSRTLPVHTGGQVLVGLGAVVLGILGIIGLDPLTLILVGLLSLGVAALSNGIAQRSR